MSTRCGIGYDLHRLADGRKFIVGGIELPFDKGPVGHSDGDVLAHAVCDALFGAAGLGDIVITEKPKLGPHFPRMREALAKALGISVEKIHLKAKTNEGVDAIGRGEAIAAHAVATLVSR